MATKDNPTYAYFNIRGVQFPVRLLLAYTGEKHTPKTYALHPAATDPNTTLETIFPALMKAEQEKTDEWYQDKGELGLDFPTMPYLSFGEGRAFSQTKAIAHYIARKHGLEANGSEKERVIQDMMIGVYQDLWDRFRGAVVFVPKEKAAESHGMYKQVFLPKQLAQFESFLGSKLFAIGDKMTTADFFLFDLLEMLQRFSPDTFAAYPNVSAYIARIRNLPAIDKMYNEHPEYAYPIFPPFLSWGT